MTTLVRFREPLRNVAMNGEFERLIKTMLDTPARAGALANHVWAPPLDVWETEGELVYAFDLPGIPEEAIAVAERSLCRRRYERNRHCVAFSLALRPDRVAGGSAL